MDTKQHHSGARDNVRGNKASKTSHEPKTLPISAQWIGIIGIPLAILIISVFSPQSIKSIHSGTGDIVNGDKYTNIPDADVTFKTQNEHVLEDGGVYISTYEVFVVSKYPIEVLRLTALGQDILKDGIEFYPSNAGVVFPLRHSYTEAARAVEYGNVAPGSYTLKISQNSQSPLQVSGEIVD